MENRTERIQFRLEPSVKEMAQILAKKEGRSISSYLVELIKRDWETNTMKFYTLKEIEKEELPNGFYEKVHRISPNGAEESYMRLSPEEAAEKCIKTGHDHMCENCTYDGKNENTCPVFFTISK